MQGRKGEANLILFGAAEYGCSRRDGSRFCSDKILNNCRPLLALVLRLGYKSWKVWRVVAQLFALKQQGATLLDVRLAAEVAQAKAPGMRHMPLQDVGAWCNEISRNAPGVVGCASRARSGMAKMPLKRKALRRFATWALGLT